MTSLDRELRSHPVDDDPVLLRITPAAAPWDDVVGHPTAKRDLQAIAALLRSETDGRALLNDLGPVLLCGPRGTGKSLLVRSLIHAAGVPAFVWLPERTQSSDPFSELAGIPSIVLARDEFGRHDPARAAWESQCIARNLDQLSLLRSAGGPLVIIIQDQPSKSTDAPACDAPTVRQRIVVRAPGVDDRHRMWTAWLTDLPAHGSIDVSALADRTSGFTGAEIRTAIALALARGHAIGIDALDQDLLNEAVRERGWSEDPRPITSEVRERHAVHMAGHTIAAALLWGVAAVEAVILADPPSRSRIVLTDDGMERVRRARGAIELTQFSRSGAIAEEIVLDSARRRRLRCQEVLLEVPWGALVDHPKDIAAAWDDLHPSPNEAVPGTSGPQDTALGRKRTEIIRVAAELSSNADGVVAGCELRSLLTEAVAADAVAPTGTP
jgi:hypothetical protein